MNDLNGIKIALAVVVITLQLFVLAVVIASSSDIYERCGDYEAIEEKLRDLEREYPHRIRV